MKISCLSSTVMLASFVLFASLQVSRADIQSTSVDSGTVGTVVSVSGTNFGNGVGKLLLSELGSSSSYQLKVLSWSKDKIVGKITKAKFGSFNLVVKTKKKPSQKFTSPFIFTIVKPAVLSFDPAQIIPGMKLSVVGDYFGKPQGVVRFNNKVAKVSSWDNNLIELSIPSSISWDEHSMLSIENKAGILQLYLQPSSDDISKFNTLYDKLLSDGYPNIATSCIYFYHAISSNCKPAKDVGVEVIGLDSHNSACHFFSPPSICYSQISEDFKLEDKGVCSDLFTCIVDFDHDVVDVTQFNSWWSE